MLYLPNLFTCIAQLVVFSLLFNNKFHYSQNKSNKEQNQKYMKIGGKLKSSIKRAGVNSGAKRSVTIHFRKQDDHKDPDDTGHQNNEDHHNELDSPEVELEEWVVRPSTTISLSKNSNWKEGFIKLKKNSFNQNIQSQVDIKTCMNYEENKGWKLFVSCISKDSNNKNLSLISELKRRKLKFSHNEVNRVKKLGTIYKEK